MPHHSTGNPKPPKADFPATVPAKPLTSGDAELPLGLPPSDGPADAKPSTPSPEPASNGSGAGVPRSPEAPPTAADPPPDPAPTSGPNLNPFDPARLRLNQNFAASVNVRKIITTVPVRKPSNEWFVRTHPDPEFRIETAVLELKEDREIYLVAPELREELATEPTFSLRSLVWTINRQGIAFLWPIRLPGPDGKIDSWSQSAHEAAEAARSSWVRIKANMGLQAYELDIASGALVEPRWPELKLGEILGIAFKTRFIDTWDHPVLRRLRGEV